MKLTGKKLLLIFLYAPDEKGNFNAPISGRTRLMKMGFLFEEEILGEFKRDSTLEDIILPEYFAWKYGPFSRSLLDDLEFLINQQFVKVEVSSNAPIAAELAEYMYWVEDLDAFDAREFDEEVFELTSDRGIPKAKEIWEILSDNQRTLLTEFKNVLNRASLDRILEYVYKKYQERGFVDKSLIREKYLS